MRNYDELSWQNNQNDSSSEWKISFDDFVKTKAEVNWKNEALDWCDLVSQIIHLRNKMNQLIQHHACQSKWCERLQKTDPQGRRRFTRESKAEEKSPENLFDHTYSRSRV